MPDGWTRGCVNGAMERLRERGWLLPRWPAADYDLAERQVESAYQSVKTTDNEVIADEWENAYGVGWPRDPLLTPPDA